MTNFESMDINRMAQVLTDAVSDGCPHDMDWDCAKDEYGWDGCEACWKRWLQQPAEEEEHAED